MRLSHLRAASGQGTAASRKIFPLGRREVFIHGAEPTATDPITSKSN